MSKRKLAKSSKRARSPAIATRAHVKKQAAVKARETICCALLPLGRLSHRLSFMTVQKNKLPTSRNKRLPSCESGAKSATPRCEGLILLRRRETCWSTKRSFWK